MLIWEDNEYNALTPENGRIQCPLVSTIHRLKLLGIIIIIIHRVQYIQQYNRIKSNKMIKYLQSRLDGGTT